MRAVFGKAPLGVATLHVGTVAVTLRIPERAAATCDSTETSATSSHLQSC